MTTQMMPASIVVSAMNGADGILPQRSVLLLHPPPPFYFVFCKQHNDGIQRKENLLLKTDTEFE